MMAEVECRWFEDGERDEVGGKVLRRDLRLYLGSGMQVSPGTRGYGSEISETT